MSPIAATDPLALVEALAHILAIGPYDETDLGYDVCRYCIMRRELAHQPDCPWLRLEKAYGLEH